MCVQSWDATPESSLVRKVHQDVLTAKRREQVRASQLSWAGLAASVPLPPVLLKTVQTKEAKHGKREGLKAPAASDKAAAHGCLTRSNPVPCRSASQQTEAATCPAPPKAARPLSTLSAARLLSPGHRSQSSVDLGRNEASRPRWPHELRCRLAGGVYTVVWVIGSLRLPPLNPSLCSQAPAHPGMGCLVSLLCPHQLSPSPAAILHGRGEKKP